MQALDPAVSTLQQAVLAGDWDGAAGCLDRLQLGKLPDVEARSRVLLLEGKYLEVCVKVVCEQGAPWPGCTPPPLSCSCSAGMLSPMPV